MAFALRKLAVLLPWLGSLVIEGANWAQLAGQRAQNTAAPYVPDQWHRSPGTSLRPMWSARWGHAVVVLNQSSARSYLTEEENSARQLDDDPVLVLLGGDDGLPRNARNFTAASEMGIGSGKLRNDVWIGRLASSSRSPWRVDDRRFVDGGRANPELIRSGMSWREATPGRIAPATWPAGPKRSLPLTNDEWIACQESIRDRLDYTSVLPDPSVCDDPPEFCYDDMDTAGCHPQAIWRADNMWSPRRGLGAAVANGKIFVIGGQAREYARIDDARLVGGLGGQRRVETVREHSTVREDLVLKNDIWSSADGGVTWELVNPGCKDPQEDVLLQTEVWSRDASDPSFPRLVGTIGSKCHRSSECYGVAECRAVGNTRERTCVCPMFGPRKDHAVAVQHRHSVLDDGSVFAEDVMYVVGGFTSVRQAFCANRSCGPADGYRLAMEDAWMSVDGASWTQLRPAFAGGDSFRGRGGHTALVVHGHSRGGAASEVGGKGDRLLVFGGETSNPQQLSTSYLNDIWEVDLPAEPCCDQAGGCADGPRVRNEACLPKLSAWRVVTSGAEWQERSGHTTVYEPPSSGNSFRHRIYLSGGKNAEKVLSDVWTWDLESDHSWRCDFCSEVYSNSSEAAHRVFLNKDSPLSDVKILRLPPLDGSGHLFNFTNHSATPIISDNDVSVMSSEGVTAIKDLVAADLYSVLKLRGFDYPGRHTQEVPNVCFLRAISMAIADKCSVEVMPKSYFHKKAHRRMGQSLNEPAPPILCGRGGESKPCVRGDWDGCSPIPGIPKVDVHGLGDVAVPQSAYNVSSVVEEIFCSQVPGGRYAGAAEFLDSRVVLLGGIGDNATRLYRDVWTRDGDFPQAFISMKPLSKSPQSQFYFDSNEAGAHVFEYKLIRDGIDIIPWTMTTKNVGADVAWLDDKRGGPGKGWYTLYVRSVDPSGNRDSLFSTRTNVYRWYYVPPIPWGAVAGGIITSLVLIAAGYYEYRRRKKKATLQRFQLRRLRRKFKLRYQGMEGQELNERIPPVIDGAPGLRRRSGEVSSNSRHSSSRGQRSSRRHHRKRGDEHSRSHRSRGERSKENSRASHSRRRRHHSRSRSKSRHRSRDEGRRPGNHVHPGLRERRRKRIGPEGRADDETRNRRRRDREKLRRDLRQNG